VSNHYSHKQYTINTLVYLTIIYIRGVSSSRSACGLYKQIATAWMVIPDRIFGLNTVNCALVSIYGTELVVE